jgi:hypothetical protein
MADKGIFSGDMDELASALVSKFQAAWPGLLDTAIQKLNTAEPAVVNSALDKLQSRIPAILDMVVNRVPDVLNKLNGKIITIKL